MHRTLVFRERRGQKQERGRIIINKPLNVVSNNFQDELVPNNVPDVRQGNDRVPASQVVPEVPNLNIEVQFQPFHQNLGQVPQLEARQWIDPQFLYF
jgi:hypothetical protein